MFNNSVILQWVQGVGTAITFTLPISYTGHLCVVGVTGNGTGNTYKYSLNSVRQTSYGYTGTSQLMVITIGF